MFKKLQQLCELVAADHRLGRRDLLAAGAAGMGLTALTHARSALTATPHWDVHYNDWEKSLDAVLDYEDQVAMILGPDVAADLHLVRRNDNDQFGLVYDRNGTEEQAQKTAKHHGKILRNADLEGAEAVRDDRYHELYNIVYGKGPNLGALKQSFKTVYAHLGNGVGKELFIEQIGQEFALVYRRRGEPQETLEKARRHARLLAGTGIMASIIRERNNPVVYSENQFLAAQEPEEPAPKVPPKMKEEPRPRIRAPLQQQIEEYIRSLRGRGKLAAHEKTAWVVYDLTANQKLVSINEDTPMQAASMVKPAPIGAIYLKEAELRHVRYDAQARRKFQLMIQNSSNPSTDWMIRKLGGPGRVNALVDRHFPEIFRDTSIVEYIGGGRTYRNKVSAHDYSRFLYALWHNQLPSSREMKRVMALPKRNRLYSGASRVPSGTLVYDKTGTTARLCGDMGILVGRNEDGKRRAPYIVVGIIESGTRRSHYGQRGEIIREVSNMAYDFMADRYNLKKVKKD